MEFHVVETQFAAQRSRQCRRSCRRHDAVAFLQQFADAAHAAGGALQFVPDFRQRADRAGAEQCVEHELAQRARTRGRRSRHAHPTTHRDRAEDRDRHRRHQRLHADAARAVATDRPRHREPAAPVSSRACLHWCGSRPAMAASALASATRSRPPRDLPSHARPAPEACEHGCRREAGSRGLRRPGRCRRSPLTFAHRYRHGRVTRCAEVCSALCTSSSPLALLEEGLVEADECNGSRLRRSATARPPSSETKKRAAVAKASASAIGNSAGCGVDVAGAEKLRRSWRTATGRLSVAVTRCERPARR